MSTGWAELLHQGTERFRGILRPALMLSNLRPIFILDVVVDFHGEPRSIEPVASIAARAGNPVFLPVVHVEIVGLKPRPFQTLEPLVPVIKRAAGARKSNPADAGIARQFASL